MPKVLSRSANIHDRKTQKLRVALAQVECLKGDVRGNIAKAIEIIDGLRGQADLVVFPEYFLTGYLTGSHSYKNAMKLGDAPFRELVAATEGISAAVGFIEESDDIRFFNSLAIIGGRRVLSVHRKVYLVNYGIFEERKTLSSGTRHALIDIGPFRTAPFVCADAWNPGMVHLAAIEGAQLCLFPANSPVKGLGPRICSEESWKRMNRFYSSMYGMYVLFVNRTGVEGKLRFWGGSELIDPFGKPVVTAGAGEEILRAEIDIERVREARTILHTTRDEDLGFLGRRLEDVIARRRA